MRGYFNGREGQPLLAIFEHFTLSLLPSFLFLNIKLNDDGDA